MLFPPEVAASGMHEESVNPEWMCAGDHESSLTPTFGYSYGSSGNRSVTGRRSLSFCASDASRTTSVDSGFHTQSQNRPTSMSPGEIAAVRQNTRAVDFGTQSTKADSLIPPLHTKVGRQTSKHLQLVSTIPPSCDSIPKKHNPQASMYSFLSVEHLKSEHDDILQQNFDMNELYQPSQRQRQLFTIPDHEEDSDIELDPSYMKLCTDQNATSSPIKRNVSSVSLLVASPSISIKVPSRNGSSASLLIASPTNAQSRNGSLTTLPVEKLPHSRRQSSSSDSSNSSSSPPSSNSSISYLSLSPSDACNSIKDLSAIPPKKQQSLLSRIVQSTFRKLTQKSAEDTDTTPEYMPGFGFKM